ncbi:hypothetical protein LTR84_011896 [Exophiala bonariae]|uniref:Uncharacterized protein n=1 Tax=Exophiala bonariae TaxID=1690606 RepID=A0AAV9NHA5_9EURO|nr:hypothetical protein LTR84_011896 [Exophiala bonariae]
MSYQGSVNILMGPDPRATEHAYQTMLKQQEQQKRKQQQKEEEAKLRAKVKAMAAADDASSFSSVSTIVSLRSALRRGFGGAAAKVEGAARRT